MYNILFEENADNQRHYWGFVSGEERSLIYLYQHAWCALQHTGLRIVNNEFVVSCILQEAILHSWEHRTSMKDMKHIYFFIRQNLVWKCFAWLRSKQHRFYHIRCISFNEAFTDEAYSLTQEDQQETELVQLLEDRKKLVYNAIPYLPLTKQNIVLLALKYGFSCKEIALRLGYSANMITHQLQECASQLRQVIHASRDITLKDHKTCETFNLNKLDTVKEKIVSMRRTENKSFDCIADAIGLDALEVKCQYIEALKLLRKN